MKTETFLLKSDKKRCKAHSLVHISVYLLTRMEKYEKRLGTQTRKTVENDYSGAPGSTYDDEEYDDGYENIKDLDDDTLDEIDRQKMRHKELAKRVRQL